MYSVKLWVDALLAIHPDIKRHIVSIMSLVKVAIKSNSLGKILNTRISIESELVVVDDVTSTVLR